MADGKIRIDTRINTDGAIKDSKQLEQMADNCAKHIKNAFNTISTTKGVETALKNQSKQFLDAKAKAEEYERQLADVNSQMRSMEASALKDADISMKGDTPRKVQDRADASLTGNKDYQKLIDQSLKLEDSWSRQNQKMKDANTNVQNLQKKMSDLNTASEKATKNQDKLKESTNKVKKSIDGTKNSAKMFSGEVTKSADKVVRKLGRMALAVFSVRTAYTMVSRAGNQYLQSNQAMADQVKGIWTTIGNVIGPVINSIVGWIVNLITYLNALIKVFTGVDLVARANATALKNQAKQTKKVADETKKANKQLADFDDMDRLESNKDTQSSGANDLQLFTPKSVDVSGIQNKLKEMFEPLKNAWANYGKSFTDSFKYALDQMWGVIKAIGKSFSDVWKNGTGEKTCSIILRILTNIFTVIGNIAKAFKESWDNAGVGTKIIQNLWDIVNILLGAVEAVTIKFKEWSKSANFDGVLNFIEKITGGLKNILANIDPTVLGFSMLGIAIVKALSKLNIGGAIIGSIMTAFTSGKLLDGIAKFITVTIGGIGKLFAPLGGVFATLGGKIMSLCPALSSVTGFFGQLASGLTPVINAFTSFIASTTGIITILALVIFTIVDLWNTSEEFRTSIETIITSIMGILQTLWETIGKPILGAVVEVLKNVWENGLKPLYEVWKEVFNQVFGLIADLFAVLDPVIKAICELLGPVIKAVLIALQSAFGGSINAIIGIFGALLKSVGDIIAGIRKIFSGIIDFVVGVFTGDWDKAWQGVKKIFKGVFDALVAIVKAPINAVIGMINGMLSGITSGINAVIKCANKLSWEVPDWVPLIGGDTFGFSFKTMSAPQIPYLAKGGIVNRPTLAMVGEAGKEAVIPLQNNTQWMQDLANFINAQSKSEDTQQINLYIDGDKLFSWFIKKQKKQNIMLNGGTL